MTKKEFYRRPTAPSSLRGGETITVTDKGRPQFVVSPVGGKGKSGADYHADALKLFKKRKPFNSVELLRGDER